MTERKERRRHPRSRTGFALEIEGQKEPGISHVENISQSGVLCHIGRPIDEMTIMAVTIVLPSRGETANENQVECEGVVVRCEPTEGSDGKEFYRVAIFFMHISDEARSRIARFVEEDLQDTEIQ